MIALTLARCKAMVPSTLANMKARAACMRPQTTSMGIANNCHTDTSDLMDSEKIFNYVICMMGTRMVEQEVDKMLCNLMCS